MRILLYFIALKVFIGVIDNNMQRQESKPVREIVISYVSLLYSNRILSLQFLLTDIKLPAYIVALPAESEPKNNCTRVPYPAFIIILFKSCVV